MVLTLVKPSYFEYWFNRREISLLTLRCTGRHLSFVSASSGGCAVQVSPVSATVRPLRAFR
jgi:hypothetical protein